VLIYYAITNACALRLPKEDRLYPRAISWLGLAGCAGLSLFLDWQVMILGVGLLLAAHLFRAILRR